MKDALCFVPGSAAAPWCSVCRWGLRRQPKKSAWESVCQLRVSASARRRVHDCNTKTRQTVQHEDRTALFNMNQMLPTKMEVIYNNSNSFFFTMLTTNCDRDGGSKSRMFVKCWIWPRFSLTRLDLNLNGRLVHTSILVSLFKHTSSLVQHS